MKSIILLLSNIVLVVIILLFSMQAHANTVLFDHTGSANPTTEGWTHNVGTGGGTSTGAVTNAWYVEDTSTALHTWESFSQTTTSAQNADASLYGWALTTNMLMVNGTSGVHDSMHVLYRDGSTGWEMSFDTASDGDPIINFGSTYFGTFFDSYTVEGGAGAYHTYSLVYDPNASSADLFIDGTERISNYTGVGTTSSGVSWGAGSSNGTGRAHFNSVQFAIAPEPISSTLFIIGGATLGFRRFRKKLKK